MTAVWTRPRLLASVLLAAIAWLGGCTCAGSLRPLQSDEPLTLIPDLSGKWVSEEKNSNEKEYYLIENAGGPAYRVTNVNQDEELQDIYDLSLVQVGSYTFFDAAFKEAGNKETNKSAYDLGVLPIHFIGRIWADGDNLRLGLLDYDWLNQMMSSGQLKLPHVEQNQGGDDHILLLTAESDKLKEFVRQYAESGAFSMVVNLHRVPLAVEPTANSKR